MYPFLLLHSDTHTFPSHLILYCFYFKNQKGQLVLPINSWMYAFPLEHDRFIMGYTLNKNWLSLFQTLSISSNCSTMGGASIATFLHNVRTSFLELGQSFYVSTITMQLLCYFWNNSVSFTISTVFGLHNLSSPLQQGSLSHGKKRKVKTL